jgi:hypothetical protein
MIRSDQKQETLAKNWKHPIGTPVVLRKDDGTLVKTKTRSDADLIGGRAVIWLEGISGCYDLSRVTPVEVIEEVEG